MNINLFHLMESNFTFDQFIDVLDMVQSFLNKFPMKRIQTVVKYNIYLVFAFIL
jgi:hypothetical protein